MLSSLDYTKPIFVVYCYALSGRGWYEVGYTANPIVAEYFADQFRDYEDKEISADVYQYNVHSDIALIDAVYKDLGILLTDEDKIELRVSYNDTQYFTTEQMSMNDNEGIYDIVEHEGTCVARACIRLQLMAKYLKNQNNEFMPFLEFIFRKYVVRLWCVLQHSPDEFNKISMNEIGLGDHSSILDVFDTDQLIYDRNYSFGGK